MSDGSALTETTNRRTSYPSALPRDVETFVTAYGIERTGGAIPLGWGRRRRRRPGRCYEAAGQYYREDGVAYAEGRALCESGWLPHAWLVRADGIVIDLAWRTPGQRYLGIELPDRVVEDAHRILGHYGPLLPAVVRSLYWRPALPRRLSMATADAP